MRIQTSHKYSLIVNSKGACFVISLFWCENVLALLTFVLSTKAAVHGLRAPEFGNFYTIKLKVYILARLK